MVFPPKINRELQKKFFQNDLRGLIHSWNKSLVAEWNLKN